jgi:hypothetical protein
MSALVGNQETEESNYDITLVEDYGDVNTLFELQ